MARSVWDHDLPAQLVAPFLGTRDLRTAMSVSRSWRHGARRTLRDGPFCPRCDDPACRFTSHEEALLKLGVWTDDCDGSWECDCADRVRLSLRGFSPLEAITIQTVWQLRGWAYFALLRQWVGRNVPEVELVRKIFPVSFHPSPGQWVQPRPTVPLWVQARLLGAP